MSFNKSAPKLPMSATAVLSVLADAARSEPAKIVARKVGVSSRHVRNIANGNTSPSIEIGLAFAVHYEPVRRFFAKVLGMEDGPMDPEFQREFSKAAQAWLDYQARRK